MGVIDEKALEAAMIAYRTADYDRAHAPGPLPDVSVSVSAAITAYLSAFPPRELLREALEALEPFADKAGDYIYEDPAHHGIVFISDLRRARAAWLKISAVVGGA